MYVDVSDIKKERERQCERILEEYRSRRDRLAIARESKSKRTIDLYKKDASSYNLDATLKKVTVTPELLFILFLFFAIMIIAIIGFEER